MSSESVFFVCGCTQRRNRVSPEVRVQVFLKRRLLIPKTNRCCVAHIVHHGLYEEDLMSLKMASLMDTEDIKAYVEMPANAADATTKDRVGNFSLTDEQIKLN